MIIPIGRGGREEKYLQKEYDVTSLGCCEKMEEKRKKLLEKKTLGALET